VNAKQGSAVLVVTSWSSAELLANLPATVTSLILERGLHLYIIDTKTSASTLVGAAGPAHDAVQTLLAHLAFLRLYLGASASEALVYQVARKSLGDVVQGIELKKINAHAWTGLQEIGLMGDPTAAIKEPPQSTPSSLKHFEFNAIAVDTDEGITVVNGARLGSWHDAAKHLLFPAVFSPPTDPSIEIEEDYPKNPALRPEVPERTFLVTTTVNRRLTPQEYNRNVFHLEFDTSGTGLKYAIGEALGIHGWNDEQDVLDFCAFYGADSRQLITVPVVAGEGKMQTRTAFQALQQQVDLFGRPPKAFYSDLAAYATSAVDKHALQFIGSPEGSATFKKLAEKDTVTFADILQRYSSARPSIEKLCELIGDIKPRHYSIASSQSVVGNRVDLLVVTVDWVTPSGMLTIIMLS
jgi:sulfite reductase (NADPH) flavoprotein alpha-component